MSCHAIRPTYCPRSQNCSPPDSHRRCCFAPSQPPTSHLNNHQCKRPALGLVIQSFSWSVMEPYAVSSTRLGNRLCINCSTEWLLTWAITPSWRLLRGAMPVRNPIMLFHARRIPVLWFQAFSSVWHAPMVMQAAKIGALITYRGHFRSAALTRFRSAVHLTATCGNPGFDYSCVMPGAAMGLAV